MFTIKREAFKEGVDTIKILPYYSYGICIRVYSNGNYELWNYERIPLSVVSKVIDNFLSENPAIRVIYVGEKEFFVPEPESRRSILFDFLSDIEKSNLERE